MHRLAHGSGIHLLGFPNEADIHRFSFDDRLLLKLTGYEDILARKSSGPPSEFIDGRDDRGVDFLVERLLHDLDRRCICRPEALDETSLQSSVLHACGDGFAATMDEDRIDSDCLEKNDITKEFIDDLVVLHRGATILDHEGLAAIFLDVGQRLDEAFGADFGCGEHLVIRRDSVAHTLR